MQKCYKTLKKLWGLAADGMNNTFWDFSDIHIYIYIYNYVGEK